MLDTHTVTIEWSEGISETIELAAGINVFSTDHVYDDAGEYTVLVTVYDDGGGQDSITFMVIATHRLYLPTIQR